MKDDRLIYVESNGTTADGKLVYTMYFSDNTKTIPNDEWEEPVAGLCCDLRPEFVPYDKIIVSMETPLDLAKDCLCLGMVDAMNGIVALAWENIDSYTEYPEDGRVVFRHGEKRSTVYSKLERRSADISE